MAAKYVTNRLAKHSPEVIRAMMNEATDQLLSNLECGENCDVVGYIENALDMVECGDFIVHHGKMLSVALDAWKLTDDRYRS